MTPTPPDLRRERDDFDQADVELHIRRRYRLSSPVDFPRPCYRVEGAPFWTAPVVRQWLEAYHQTDVVTHPEFAAELLTWEQLLRPHETPEQHRANAATRWVDVATAAALTRKPFDPHK